MSGGCDAKLCDQWQRAPRRRRTVGADKAYDDRAIVGLARELGVTPHVTQNTTRTEAVPSTSLRRDTQAMPRIQHARPRIEPSFGLLKTSLGSAK